MIKFIKLTEIISDGTNKPVILNTASIQCFQYGTKGRDTHIRMFDKSFFFVKENMDELWGMLEPNLNYIHKDGQVMRLK